MPHASRSRRALTATVLGATLLVTAAACADGSEPFRTGPLGASAPSGPSGSTSPTVSGTPTSAPTTAAPTESPTTKAGAQLPRGGRTVFPRYRLVGYAGRTGSTALGRLGVGDLNARVSELEKRAKPYAADGREVLPVMEVIATTVQASPGQDKKYRTRMSDAQVKRYLDVARRHHALLLLAIQPGRSDFLTEVKAYDRWLAEPDVGVALDPEWAMGKGQVPGRTFGHTTGAALDAVAAHLSSIVAKDDLPQKVMVFHELAARIVTRESKLHTHAGVAVVKSVDGIGSPAAKRNTYRVVNADTPKGVQPGFKLFYEEDKQTGKRLMTPAQVLALRPRPAYVMYE